MSEPRSCKCCCCRCSSSKEAVGNHALDENFNEVDPESEFSEEVENGDGVHVINLVDPMPLTRPGNTLSTKDITASSSITHVNRWNIAVYEGKWNKSIRFLELLLKSISKMYSSTEDDPSFTQLLIEAEAAIEAEILPQRIHQGSSGSYFVKNSDKVNIGVFKPKDEEPYGTMNPKWAKWFQRKCCPCCFGRGCLIPNVGYLSEAGAYLVDMKLGLNVVPRTKVIRMASSTFHYGKIRRNTAKAKKTLADRFPAVGKRFHRIGLPLKVRQNILSIA